MMVTKHSRWVFRSSGVINCDADGAVDNDENFEANWGYHHQWDHPLSQVNRTEHDSPVALEFTDIGSSQSGRDVGDYFLPPRCGRISRFGTTGGCVVFKTFAKMNVSREYRNYNERPSEKSESSLNKISENSDVSSTAFKTTHPEFALRSDMRNVRPKKALNWSAITITNRGGRALRQAVNGLVSNSGVLIA